MAWVRRGAITTISFAALVVLFVTLRWGAVDAGTPTHQVVLVVRDMAFYVDGQFDRPNPALAFRSGERVRLVLRNEEIGMRHNFAVPGWEVSTEEVNGKGTTQIDFVVPAEKGRREYICEPHPAMMRGTIDIQ